MSRSTRAEIDLDALRHNYARFKALAPRSQVMAVIKADAYGHGAVAVARALADADLMGVAYIDEALQLRAAGIVSPLVLLEGVMNAGEYALVQQHDLQVVIHREEQLDWLAAAGLTATVVVWLKVDTGMHRLGVDPADVSRLLTRLRSLPCVAEVVMMSHMACADEPGHPLNALQEQRFNVLTDGAGCRRSLANSAATLLDTRLHLDIVRPGILLYGAAAAAGQDVRALGFRPVMRLTSPVISVRTITSGESVGYGATWVAQRETRVAIIAIGYGDGYPRHVGPGAAVHLAGQRCPVIGRVSMDMLAVDVTEVAMSVGDQAELWGPALPVDTVAAWAGTLNYELLCQVTDRVRRCYAGGIAS
jgi:alanine racemase